MSSQALSGSCFSLLLFPPHVWTAILQLFANSTAQDLSLWKEDFSVSGNKPQFHFGKLDFVYPQNLKVETKSYRNGSVDKSSCCISMKTRVWILRIHLKSITMRSVTRELWRGRAGVSLKLAVHQASSRSSTKSCLKKNTGFLLPCPLLCIHHIHTHIYVNLGPGL